MNKKAGFTLIELLVVMVIIGILATILMPVFGKAREGARRAMCANNLRQHGIAWYLYLDEHNECFPKLDTNASPSEIQCNEYTFGGKAGTGWTYPAVNRPLNRYLDVTDASAEIFHCPDDIKEQTIGEAVGKTIFDYYGTSYYFNFYILQFGNWFPSFTQRPLSTITSPQSKVLLEMCFNSNFPGHGGKGPVSPNTPVMVLFVDGHVKGPYKYNSEFDEIPSTESQKPVYEYPNTTPWPLD